MGSDRAAWSSWEHSLCSVSIHKSFLLPEPLPHFVHPWVKRVTVAGPSLCLSLGLDSCVLGEASRPGTDSSKASPLKIA